MYHPPTYGLTTIAGPPDRPISDLYAINNNGIGVGMVSTETYGTDGATFRPAIFNTATGTVRS